MSETTAPESSSSQPQVKKKSKKLLFIIAAIVVLLGGGAGGFFYLSRARAAETVEKNAKSAHGKNKTSTLAADEEIDETATADDHGAENADAKPAEKSAGKNAVKQSLKVALPEDEAVKHVIELQPFIVNLADAEEARYLRLTLSIGVDGEHGGESEKPDPIFTTRVRNAILAVLTVKKSEDVLTVEGKSKLRKELLEAAQAASAEPHVQAVYITDFIVQL